MELCSGFVWDEEMRDTQIREGFSPTLPSPPSSLTPYPEKCCRRDMPFWALRKLRMSYLSTVSPPEHHRGAAVTA